MIRVALLILVAFCLAEFVRADVVVLANRTSKAIPLQIVRQGAAGRTMQFASLDVISIPAQGRQEIQVTLSQRPTRIQLDANCAYFFGKRQDGTIAIQQIGLNESDATRRGRKIPGSQSGAAVIRVRLFVDDEEPARTDLWQARLRNRIAQASATLQRQCGVKLQVVGYGKWNSDNSRPEFGQTFREFETEVKADPSEVAIGFTSQYEVVSGRTHLGGIRGPLHSHILLREWSRRVNERERLELLVHELGHYLGAAHSPESISVMRPVLGGQRRQRENFRIQFDPVNALITFLVGEEIRGRSIRHLGGLSAPTRQRLAQIYTELQRANPKDASVKRNLVAVSRGLSQPRESQQRQSQPLVHDTRRILHAIMSAADSNAKQGPPAGKLSGDALTEHLIRRAAAAAAKLPAKEGRIAFLLAVGIALDDSTTLREHANTRQFVQHVESDAARARRQGSLAQPTMLDRRDWAQHFVVSAYLSSTIGSHSTERLGQAKELVDAAGGSGFSFADIAADKAGIVFARRVLSGDIHLTKLAEEFRVVDYLPPMDNLPDCLTLSEFRAQFGHANDDRYKAKLREIDQRIDELPAYTKVAAQQ